MLEFVLLVQSAITNPAADPWAVFSAICMRGESLLPAAMVRESAASEMPYEARHALGNNLIDTAVFSSLGIGSMQISAATTMPNKVYALKDSQGYFVLPHSGDKKSNPFVGMCALVIKGDHYLAALQQLNSRAAAKLAKKLSKKDDKAVGVSDFRARSGNHEVTLTMVDRWTSVAVNTLH